MDAPVDVMYVAAPELYPVAPRLFQPMMDALSKKKQDRLEKFVASAPGISARALYMRGFPVSLILQQEREKPYQFLAVGTQGKSGLGRAFLGSVAEELVRRSSLPVLVTGPKVKTFSAAHAKKKPLLLVATDLGESSKRAEAVAFRLASQIQAKVVLFHNLYEGMHPVLQTAFALPSAGLELDRVVRDLKKSAEQDLEHRRKKFEAASIPCEVIIQSTPVLAAPSILKAIVSKQATYAILGTHGRNPMVAAFLGSTARKVIHDSTVPVIAAPPSPAT